jgi:hypothetical protein
MRSNRLIKNILITAAFLYGVTPFVQSADNDRQKNNDGIPPGLVGMRAQIERLTALDARYGIRSDAGTLVWHGALPSKKTWGGYDTYANTGKCADCAKGGLGFYKAAILGDDYRKRKESYLSDKQELESTGTLMMVCPDADDPSGFKISTGNYVGKNLVLVASHGVLTFSERRTIEENLFSINRDDTHTQMASGGNTNFSEKTIENKFIDRPDKLNGARSSKFIMVPSRKDLAETKIKEKFRDNINKCRILVVVNGHPVDQAFIHDFKNESYGFDIRAQEMDFAFLKTSPFSKTEPRFVKLKASIKVGLLGSKVTLIAFHDDIEKYRKVISSGIVNTFDQNHFLFKSTNLVGHSVDTAGQSSGGCLYDEKKNCVAMHLGGWRLDVGEAKGEYNGLYRANYAMVIDPQVIESINRFKN